VAATAPVSTIPIICINYHSSMDITIEQDKHAGRSHDANVNRTTSLMSTNLEAVFPGRTKKTSRL
jgi:phage replication-related protein YjqB (UPF0714/DUF867 family)